MEYGLDAWHAELHQRGPDPPQGSSRRHPVRPGLRVFGKFHPAAVARRSRPRQALDTRADAGRRLAALRELARLLRLHVRTSRQEADVHGLRVRPRTRMESRSFARLAPSLAKEIRRH